MQGILFKEEMFKAVIEDRKTQTRRVITKLAKDPTEWKSFALDGTGEGYIFWSHDWHSGLDEETKKLYPKGGIKPTYKPGRTYFLKEPYRFDEEGQIIYKYDLPDDHPDLNKKRFWKNKMFMPESEARYYIKVNEVDSERLKDITLIDIIKEGVDSRGLRGQRVFAKWIQLWNSINKKPPFTWNDNPWVWVYKFERVQ